MELVSTREVRSQLSVRIVAATDLRDAVEAFNNSPISISAVDQLRERVLRIADFLAPPVGHSERV